MELYKKHIVINSFGMKYENTCKKNSETFMKIRISDTQTMTKI